MHEIKSKIKHDGTRDFQSEFFDQFEKPLFSLHILNTKKIMKAFCLSTVHFSTAVRQFINNIFYLFLCSHTFGFIK